MHILEHTGALLSVFPLRDDNKNVHFAIVVADASIDGALKLLVYAILLGSARNTYKIYIISSLQLDSRKTYSSRNSSGTGSVN